MSGLMGKAFGSSSKEETTTDVNGSEQVGTWVDSPSAEFGQYVHQPSSSISKDVPLHQHVSVSMPSEATSADSEKTGEQETQSKSQKNGKKASEVFEGRDGERERKLTDEAGRRPAGLPAVKKEEMPGPRNEIVLDPRISAMHVSILCDAG